MTNKLILSAIAAAATLAAAGSAHACPAGYEAVWIQGNKVCKFAGVAGNNSLKAPSLPDYNKSGDAKVLKHKQLKSTQSKHTLKRTR
ncbi:MAG: hypothetical protein ACFCUR_15775 [Rhodomicrobiaceae bacterium]